MQDHLGFALNLLWTSQPYITSEMPPASHLCSFYFASSILSRDIALFELDLTLIFAILFFCVSRPSRVAPHSPQRHHWKADI